MSAPIIRSEEELKDALLKAMEAGFNLAAENMEADHLGGACHWLYESEIEADLAELLEDNPHFLCVHDREAATFYVSGDSQQMVVMKCNKCDHREHRKA